MGKATDRIQQIGILPVAILDDPALTAPLANALCRGGIPCMEVLFRSKGALERMKEMKAARPEMFVGAGTILFVEQAAEAIDNGADFIVSPGFDPEMLALCQSRGVDLIPGCTSASEVQQAYKAGLRVVKYFPSKNLGGLPAIEDLAGPFAGMKFLPTGGITIDELPAFMSSPAIAAVGGSFVGTRLTLERGDFAEIEARCRLCMSYSLGFELAHIGLNHGSREEARQTAELLCGLLSVTPTEQDDCIRAGDWFECGKGPGERGHVGFRTNSVMRALAWARFRGLEIDERYSRYDESGELTDFCLKQQIAGFAIHFMQK